jgi:hypothetical protein
MARHDRARIGRPLLGLMLVLVPGAGLGGPAAEHAASSAAVLHMAGDVTPCTATEVRALVTSFIRAFNRGETEQLDSLFAGEPDFQWYSTGPPGTRLRTAAMDRSSLIRYFGGRHARAEHLTLRTFRFNGNTSAPKPYGNFVFTLTRKARDLRPTRFHGKGAAHCYAWDDAIIVWSMARQVA